MMPVGDRYAYLARLSAVSSHAMILNRAGRGVRPYSVPGPRTISLNAEAGTGLGMQNLCEAERVVLVMLPAAVVPLLIRNRVVQVVAPWLCSQSRSPTLSFTILS